VKVGIIGLLVQFQQNPVEKSNPGIAVNSVSFKVYKKKWVVPQIPA